MNATAPTHTRHGEPTTSREIAALVAATGLGDAHILATLHAHGLRGETVPLLEWLPAIEVSWLGRADLAERHAVRMQYLGDDQASEAGMAFLDRWLSEPPPARFLAAGRHALRARLQWLDPEARAAAVKKMLARAEAAGRASGSAFGVGALSPAERALIQGLRRDLQPFGAS